MVEQTVAEEAAPAGATASLDVGSLEFDIHHSYQAMQKQVLEEVIEQQFVTEGVEYDKSDV